MGAVAYDPKVVTIWAGFRQWFADRSLNFDYVLYSHYERQTEDLVAGRIDAAWNSPLAWVHTRRLVPEARALAMRDTDRDLTSVRSASMRAGICCSTTPSRTCYLASGYGSGDRLAAAVRRRHDVLAAPAGLSDSVHDALVVLAAGEWSREAISRGWARVQQLQADMDQGRRRRLVRLGFSDDEAAELSVLHTRNFM